MSVAADLDRARSLLDVGRPADAAVMVARAVAAEPDNHAAHQVLAAVQLRLGDPARALAAIETALRLAPAEPYSHYLHAAILLSLRRGPQSVEAAREVVRLAPDSWASHSLLSATLVGRDPRGAVEAADRAVALAPDQPEAYVARAQAAQAVRRTRVAVGALRRALALAPDDRRVLAALSDLHLHRGRPVAALNVAGELAAAHPTTESLRLRLIRSSWSLVLYPNAVLPFVLLLGLGMIDGNEPKGPVVDLFRPAATPFGARLGYAVIAFVAVIVASVWTARSLTPAARRIFRREVLTRPAALLGFGGSAVALVGIAAVPLATRAEHADTLGAFAAGSLTLLVLGAIAGVGWPALREVLRETSGRTGAVPELRRAAAVWAVLAIYPVPVSVVALVALAVADATHPMPPVAAIAGAAGAVGVNLVLAWPLHRRAAAFAPLRRPVVGWLYAALCGYAVLAPGGLILATGSEVPVAVLMCGVLSAWAAAVVALIGRGRVTRRTL